MVITPPDRASVAPLLSVKNVGYRVNGNSLLQEISLSARAGELVGLIGPNGAGKSTLLKLITGLLSATEGTITLAGAPLATYSRRQIAQNIAYVPQITALDFPFSVRQIVLMGRNPYLGRFTLETEHDRQIADRAMQRTQTSAFADRLVGTLSGGERQRVLIARALTQEPKLLLLDEPTANLDIQHQVRIFDLVVALVRQDGLAGIAAVHDLELAARFCDRLVLLHRGRICATGTPEDVLSAENIRTAYGIESRAYRDPVTGHLRLAVLDSRAGGVWHEA